MAVALAIGARRLRRRSDKQSSTRAAASRGGGSQPGEGKPAVTLGDKNFTEQYILGQLYAQALRGQGLHGQGEVQHRLLGDHRQGAHRGKIDMYPEYTGVVLSEIAHDQQAAHRRRRRVPRGQAFEEGRGFTLLDKTPFYDVRCAGGQARVRDQARPDERRRPQEARHELHARRAAGVRDPLRGPGRAEAGLRPRRPTFKPLAIGLSTRRSTAARSTRPTCFTTDGQLRGQVHAAEGPEEHLRLPERRAGRQQEGAGRRGAGVPRRQRGQAKLTNEAMQKMNAAVDLDKQKPADVAKQFLQANSLL